MVDEKICKYVGFACIGFFIFYLITRTLKFQLNMIEGMTTSSPQNTDIANTPLAITNNTSPIEDTLLISKYYKKYEDTIIELDKNIDYTLLQSILKNAEIISANPTSDNSLKMINTINTLKSFKDSLNEGMAFMHSVSSSK